MMKSMCALTRRPDFSRADFQSYYEDNHAPLAVRYFPFCRYARNHLIDAPDIGFDTISEFWAKDIAALAGLMEGPVGEIMRTDERKFMDRSCIASAGADEHLLSDGAPAGPDGERCAVLLDWSDGDYSAAMETVPQWSKAIAAATGGVSLDFAESWYQPVFPARAMLWLPSSAALTPPPPIISTRVLRVRRVETPAEALLAA
jgi:uncharacterized protein (TIGR02118 family)